MSSEMSAKIRQLRLNCGLTQGELGRQFGVFPQAVSKWEISATLPDIQLMPKLAALFGISIDELFSITDETRLEQIENMVCSMRFIPEKDFTGAVRWLLNLLAESGRAAQMECDMKTAFPHWKHMVEEYSHDRCA